MVKKATKCILLENILDEMKPILHSAGKHPPFLLL